MASPAPNEQSKGISTWDASPPYKPGLPDFNGAALVNNGLAPPNPATFPTANLLNTFSLLLASLCAMAQNARVSVVYSGGLPVLDSGVAAAGVSPGATNPIPGLTIIRTVGGAANGDVFVYWAAGTFPPAGTRPTVCMNGAAPGFICADWYTDGSGNTGVRIVAKNTSGTATDLPFTVEVS